jgi:hypothetical protein
MWVWVCESVSVRVCAAGLEGCQRTVVPLFVLFCCWARVVLDWARVAAVFVCCFCRRVCAETCLCELEYNNTVLGVLPSLCSVCVTVRLSLGMLCHVTGWAHHTSPAGFCLHLLCVCVGAGTRCAWCLLGWSQCVCACVLVLCVSHMWIVCRAARTL